MKTRLIVLLPAIIVASCGTAKQGCPATNYQEQKSKASKKHRTPKKYKSSSFNWYKG